MHLSWRCFAGGLPIGPTCGGGIWLRGDTSPVHGLADAFFRGDQTFLRTGNTSVTSLTNLVPRGSMARPMSPSQSFPGSRPSILSVLAEPGRAGITLLKMAGVMSHRTRRFRSRTACVPFQLFNLPMSGDAAGSKRRTLLSETLQMPGISIAMPACENRNRMAPVCCVPKV